MSEAAVPHLDRLLIDRALCGLTGDEQRELEQALSRDPRPDVEDYERFAAALDLALAAPARTPLPGHLRRRIEAAWQALESRAP